MNCINTHTTDTQGRLEIIMSGIKCLLEYACVNQTARMESEYLNISYQSTMWI